MWSVAFFLEVVIGGALSGIMYSLVALGFVLIFKASGVFNFAQGALVLFAALTFVLLLEFGAAGAFWDWTGWLSIALAAVSAVFLLTRRFRAMPRLPPIPMGKRNWLFTSTEVGARRVGIIQSLLVTCRLHGVDPYTYLVDVLQRISEHPAKRVRELTPRMWKSLFAHDPLPSALGHHNHDPPSH